jgi:hypothetical protein
MRTLLIGICFIVDVTILAFVSTIYGVTNVFRRITGLSAEARQT